MLLWACSGIWIAKISPPLSIRPTNVGYVISNAMSVPAALCALNGDVARYDYESVRRRNVESSTGGGTNTVDDSV